MSASPTTTNIRFTSLDEIDGLPRRRTGRAAAEAALAAS
jgi:hypothetical protein